MSDWPAGRHLVSLYEALYSRLGQGAPLARADAAVVRLHEAGRAFGELSLEIRGEDDVEEDPLVASLLEDSLRDDQSGVLTLYALAMVVGPRLLVTLRDVWERETLEDRQRILTHGSDVVVQEIRRVGVTMGHLQAPDDPQWAVQARAMVDRLDAAGWTESLGQGL